MQLRCITPPKYVIRVLKRLENHGYSAYMVGGCVRDLIMNRHPNDWDICTSALPDEVMSVFPRSHPTGIKHGTVTVIEHGCTVEVTTYRTDGDYVDHRHPENVQFINDLNGDLERRDFTINAMAFPLSGELIDPFGGIKDIDLKLIRCVGDPDTRFNEDALRMYRAFRFSSVLGFKIEDQTLLAIQKNAALSSSLARERISYELERILLSDFPTVLSDLIDFGLLGDILEENRMEADFTVLGDLPRNRSQRWAGFSALLVKYELIKNAEEFLLSLRLDSATIHCVSAGVKLAVYAAPNNKIEWKKLISRNNIEIAKCTAAACESIYGTGYVRTLHTVIAGKECCSLKNLSISGDDLLKLGFHGPELGQVLYVLLDHVIENPNENENDLLLALAKQIRK